MIPATPDDVTAKWLAEVLGQPVKDIEKEPIGVGVGMLGDLVRVRTGLEDPASVVVKLPTHQPPNKALGMSYRFYEREARFFQEVAPTCRLRIPKVHHVDMDLASERFVIVLEDLSHLELGDQVAGLTVDQAVTAVQAIAPFHAQWWESPDLTRLDWLPSADDPITMQAAQLYKDAWPTFVERWAHVVPAGGIELGERVRDAYPRMLTELARPPRTFVHTDYRLDNLFFDPDGGTVTVIDFQLCTRSSGVYDVAYLLSQSMDTQLRRDNQETIIRAWYERLCQAGVTDYSWEQAMFDYGASVLGCTVIAVGAGAEIELGNERGEELVKGIADRGFSAALDVDYDAVLARVSG